MPAFIFAIAGEEGHSDVLLSHRARKGCSVLLSAESVCHQTEAVVYVTCALAAVLCVLQAVRADPTQAERPKMQL